MTPRWIHNHPMKTTLPSSSDQALCIGRMWQPGRGPFVVAVTDHALRDLSNLAPTCSSLLELESVADRVRQFIQAGHAPHLAETPAVLA